MFKKLVGIFICMLLIASVLPASGNIKIQRNNKPIKYGDIYFVGGSGPNNYTTIQEAVDIAGEGDIIYVYDDSSPYNECVTVTKSLIIQGENKETTIIDREGNSGIGFDIDADDVIITGFTIKNTGTGVHIGGVGKTASHNTITENIILNTNVGISVYYGDPFEPEFLDYGYNIISNNVISNTTFIGIRIGEGRNNMIIANKVSQTHKAPDGSYGFGIEVQGAFNTISNNHIFDNDKFGIVLTQSYQSNIYRNTIENNGEYGLAIASTSSDSITQNNFINNRRNAIFSQVISHIFYLYPGNYSIRPSTWNNNYWDKARTLPVLIPGLFSFLGLLESIVWTYINIIPINCARVDWSPAQEPFNIEI